jgi:hypothetical protein
MIVQYSNIDLNGEKNWVIFLGIGNQSEFFTLKLMGISFYWAERKVLALSKRWPFFEALSYM